MSFDEELFDQANQDRLKTIAGVVTVDSADDVDDAMARNVRLPALFTLYDGGKSSGREAARVKGQRIEPRLSVVIVAESLRSKKDGRLGALKLLRAVKNTIVTDWHPQLHPADWHNPQCTGPFVYEQDDFLERSGSRAAFEVRFRSTAWDDFS